MMKEKSLTKILVKSLLVLPCFVLQVTDAVGSDDVKTPPWRKSGSGASQSPSPSHTPQEALPPQPIEYDHTASLPDQISQLESGLADRRAELDVTIQSFRVWIREAKKSYTDLLAEQAVASVANPENNLIRRRIVMLKKAVALQDCIDADEALLQVKRAALAVGDAPAAGARADDADTASLVAEAAFAEAVTDEEEKRRKEEAAVKEAEEAAAVAAAEAKRAAETEAAEEKAQREGEEAARRAEEEAEERLREEEAAVRAATVAAEARLREEADTDTAAAAEVDGAKAACKAQEEGDEILVTNFKAWLGGGRPATDLAAGSREGLLVAWVSNSHNFFTGSNHDYTLVRTQMQADRYGGLFDLVVSSLAHCANDDEAATHWSERGSKMGPPTRPVAINFVDRCHQVLTTAGGDADESVLGKISAMMADTLVTGGRFGFDFGREAAGDELSVMMRALRLSGSRALEWAGNATEALAALATTYLDAVPTREIAAADEYLLRQHQARCFLVAASGVTGDTADINDIIATKYGDRLGMEAPQICTTRRYYADFDTEVYTAPHCQEH